MKTYINPEASQLTRLCIRPVIANENLEPVIRNIFDRVEREGDKALLAYTREFDGVSLSKTFCESNELNKLAKKIPRELKRAIDVAYANIVAFEVSQKPSFDAVGVETTPGVQCWREPRAIERVGLYVPGGTAPLFSSVLMLGVPARLAGCKNVILCTPPQADGSIDPAICYAAKLVGITKIYKIGGAQAIAAMALGTESIPKVDKVFGPGNQYATAAKTYAQNFGVAIDMPAGPSEVMVVADRSCKPDFVAADLLSQAEHGADSQVALVTTKQEIAQAVKAELEKQLKVLPRKAIAKKTLKNSFSVVFDEFSQAIKFVNEYAPEHLILSIKNPKSIAKKVNNAGSVFLGNYSPESAGDYASGTNHVLPTNGWARSYSGLSQENFYKYVTFQSITKTGASKLAPTVMIMAEAERLDAHKKAMEIRI